MQGGTGQKNKGTRGSGSDVDTRRRRASRPAQPNGPAASARSVSRRGKAPGWFMPWYIGPGRHPRTHGSSSSNAAVPRRSRRPCGTGRPIRPVGTCRPKPDPRRHLRPLRRRRIERVQPGELSGNSCAQLGCRTGCFRSYESPSGCAAARLENVGTVIRTNHGQPIDVGSERPGACTAGAFRAMPGESLPPGSPPPCFTIHGDPDARYPHIAP